MRKNWQNWQVLKKELSRALYKNAMIGHSRSILTRQRSTELRSHKHVHYEPQWSVFWLHTNTTYHTPHTRLSHSFPKGGKVHQQWPSHLTRTVLRTTTHSTSTVMLTPEEHPQHSTEIGNQTITGIYLHKPHKIKDNITVYIPLCGPEHAEYKNISLIPDAVTKWNHLTRKMVLCWDCHSLYRLLLKI